MDDTKRTYVAVWAVAVAILLLAGVELLRSKHQVQVTHKYEQLTAPEDAGEAPEDEGTKDGGEPPYFVRLRILNGSEKEVTDVELKLRGSSTSPPASASSYSTTLALSIPSPILGGTLGPQNTGKGWMVADTTWTNGLHFGILIDLKVDGVSKEAFVHFVAPTGSIDVIATIDDTQKLRMWTIPSTSFDAGNNGWELGVLWDDE